MTHRPLPILLFLLTPVAFAANPTSSPASLTETRFPTTIRPFLQHYCTACHGDDKSEGDLNLQSWSAMPDVLKDSQRWAAILEKLDERQMPPKKAKAHPADAETRTVADWFRAARDEEAVRHAGDPGLVLARRLSNAEYDYVIRDLTGIDIHAAREFPVDPANTAGFDNSGESLTMSPSLLKKYLEAAHEIASHVVLKPQGFVFVPHAMLADTDRDQYCVERIVAFYHAQNIDYADYFQAAWRFKHRAALGTPDATLDTIAADRKVSPKYLQTLWTTLEQPADDIGPLARLQTFWHQLPEDPKTARAGCEQMRSFIIQLRKKVEPRFLNIAAEKAPEKGVGAASEPMLIWKDVQYATHRMAFDPGQLQVESEKKPTTTPTTTKAEKEVGAENEFGPGHTVLVRNTPGDPDLVVPAGEREQYEAAFARFCRIFPDHFYIEERGRNYFDTTKDRGRYLNAGFHSLLGYFRDDEPLTQLLLTEGQRKELDAMWHDLDFVASASSRTYIEFCGSGAQLLKQSNQEAKAATAPADPSAREKEITSESAIRQNEESWLTRAKDANADSRVIDAIRYYFKWINDGVRWTEKARLDSEPTHLDALLGFAARAYRRPLSKEESDDILDYYHSCRSGGLDHESAIREGIVSLLMSPDVCYRIDLAARDSKIQPLSDYELASRLSFFLWSSIPDEPLLAHAAAGDLHEPAVLVGQTRRMLQDPRVRALAVEFGGSWLDFRRFNEIATVDRDRFPAFTNDLRNAMFEEPVRFLLHAIESNGSILDLVYANYTFVNPVLARHYGIPIQATSPNEWVRIDNADQYFRGGLLPMAAFMTKNAPGLRTSPVKRGNWIVKNILGEKIPAPPPNVPALPQDEAKLDLPLREMLARHREDANCATCHARFDSFGLVFEGFGPVGERRDKDLAQRPIDASATFPDGAQGTGLAGLRTYIREHRQKDFTDNLCRKLLSYALGRSPIFSDELLIREIDGKLSHDGYHFNTLIESIVTSPQFLTKRGRDAEVER